MLLKYCKVSWVALLSYCSLLSPVSVASDAVTKTSDPLVFNDYGEQMKKGLVGIGLAAVRFDTKIRFIEKQSGVSVFLDPEGNLDLPEIASVNTFYAAYRLAKKHDIGAAYFAVKRDTTFFNQEINIEDVVILNGRASLSDDTKFYFIDYGYTLFHDYRSNVKGLLGIAGLDLKYTFNASGEIIVDGVPTTGSYYKGASVFAPLPLFGIDLSFAFTSKWSVATKVALVSGSYEDIKASAFQARTDARYWFTKNVGGVIGISYFNADVTIDEQTERTEITYGYGGAYAGLHFAF
ncbi:MAG: hypothetical protein AMJ55_12345 [Gammaproteobacteria bacterium SG8_15]|nr:MAG: hypothetical protein AMJ55_12345 [Gammaproteobacteria bacterium SG8_15]